MKIATASVSVVLLSACMTGYVPGPSVPVPAFDGLAENICLPEAIIVSESLAKEGIATRIVIINTTTSSHAIVAFLYPTEMPALWVWDVYYRSVQIEADFASPTSVAIAWFSKIGGDETILSAKFM